MHRHYAKPSKFLGIAVVLTFAGFQSVNAPEGVRQGGSEAGDFVVLVVNSLLEVGDPVAKGLVFVFNHVI